MKILLKITILTFAISFVNLNFVSSQTPGVTINSNNNFINGNWSIGWQFSTDIPLTISSLGVYDQGADGLNGSKPVGLYSEAGILLASSTVPAGTGGILVNNFRYVNIAPVVIPAGTYRIAAVHLIADGDNYGFRGTYTTHPNVTYLSSRESFSSVLVFPTNANLTPPDFGIVGGNFLASETTVVPTLGQWGLIILGLLIISISSIIIVQRRNALAMNTTSK